MNSFRIRRFLLAIVSILFLMNGTPVIASAEHVEKASVSTQLATIETSFGGRIGVSAIDTRDNRRIEYRANERFLIQSTFKVMAVSAILKQSMTDKYLLQQKVTYTKKDLVLWSPITEKHFDSGMTVSELCSAAIMYSDNTATNLLVKKLGGPKAVTAFARSIGDHTFQLDGWEPELNSNPVDPRDTSTPKAMEESLKKLTLGHVLSPAQREQLVTWMKNNMTGAARIRSGVPSGWIVADKTGSGDDYGIANDIGIIWPSHCAPIVVSIYSVHDKKAAVRRDDVIASVARILIAEFAHTSRCIEIK